MRVVAREQAGTQIGLADAPAGIDPGTQQEAQVIGLRRLLETRHVGQGGEPGIATLRHHLEARPDQRTIDAEQRDDVAHGTQRHEVEPLPQVGFGSRRAVPARLAQRSVDTDAEEKGDADSGEMLVRAFVVETVGIDHGHRVGQRDLRHVVVDHDEVEAGPPGLGQRLEGGDAAIDRDDDGGAVFPDLQQGRRVGAVAFLAAVRNVDADVAADTPEEAQQQRRRGGAIDVVIAEHDDALARLDGPHQAGNRGVHVLEMRRIGQEPAQRRLEEIADRLEVDITRRQQTADRVGQAMALGNGESQPLVAEPGRPASSRQGALDAEESRALGS